MSKLSIKGADDIRKVSFNRVTKTAYSPLNQMLLSKPGEYASFKQWKDLGGNIKKGAKTEMVVFWKVMDYKNADEVDGEIKVTFHSVPILKYYRVIHISDVEGVPPLEFKEDEEIKGTYDRIESADKVISEYSKRENIQIIYGGNSAYYSPLQDLICLPQRYQFGKNTAEFYSTTFHEMVHSTGHKSRLNRMSEQKNARFGNADYSKEELVAEIGASGILNLLGIDTENSFTNSVAYIQSWLKVLQNDKRMIVSASSKVEKAVEFIFNGKANDVENESAEDTE